MGTIIFLIFISILAHNIYKSIKMKRQRSSKFKQRLKQSAMNGAAGGLAATYFINLLDKQHNLNMDMVVQMQNMNLNELQNFALQNQLINQQQLDLVMNHMHDPFQNIDIAQLTGVEPQPGQDIITDEIYFHIDHGMGMANPEHM